MGNLILISGVNGSGKSRYAEALAVRMSEKRIYIATMLLRTEDNFSRIRKHRQQREGLSFQTLELPFRVCDAPVDADAVVLLEDVSNLLSNAMFEKNATANDVLSDICALQKRCRSLIAVTISGLDPAGYGGETAAYIRALNTLNEKLAGRAELVIRMEAGHPVVQKGTLPYADEILVGGAGRIQQDPGPPH